MTESGDSAEVGQGRTSGGAAPGPGIAQDMSRLARDLQAESDEQAVRQRIVAAAVREVDGATWAGMTVVKGKHLSTVAKTADFVAEIDRLQYRAGDGPCLTSLREHITVRSDDLRMETRWPGFSQAAARRGVLAVLAFQLFVERDSLGSLNVYADKPNAFDDDESIGLLLASHAAIALRGAMTEHNLRVALDSRDLIGQAKGILMERHKVNAQQAFDMLVYASQHQHRKLRDVAEGLTATGELPSTPAP